MNQSVPRNKLSVVIPVFNEKATIAELVRRVQAVEIDKEIVIVDDYSTDGTRDVLQQIVRPTDSQLGCSGQSAPEMPRAENVRVYLQERNRGKGAAVRRGIKEASGDLILIQDADLEYDPDDWPRLLDPVLKGKASVVYGSRFTGERKNMMPLHWFGNRMLSLLTNVLYSSTLSDMETCYKLFDAKVLEGMTIVSNRFEFEPEVTAKVLRRGHRIY